MNPRRLRTLRETLDIHRSDRIDDPSLQDSAVLVALCERADALVVPFVLRSDYRSEHAGEVGLPGGRADDDEPLRRTALREAEEEIGLPSDTVDVVGRLSDAATPTGYRIAPYVGHVDEPIEFVRDETEVASLYLVSPTELAASRKHRRFDCTARSVVGPADPAVAVRGTTADILVEFFEVAGDVL